ncbi:MAG TPA: hypothetical protein VF595_12460 [Tepidisphaeraceae bacterium]|jgi:hypothetical protein
MSDLLHALEARRLFAASATLTDGTLTVVGTDESERIDVAYSLRSSTAISTSTARYVPLVAVRVDGELLGRFRVNAVKKIHVLANGGNDRVTAPANSVATLPKGSSSFLAFVGTDAEPMLIEGGSGNDRLVGGAGDDTLLGGRGDDRLTDGYGSNRLEGGRGNDVLDGVDQSFYRSLGTSPASSFISSSVYNLNGPSADGAYAPSPDTLIGGPGVDRYLQDTDDRVIETDDAAPTDTYGGSILVITDTAGLSVGLRA